MKLKQPRMKVGDFVKEKLHEDSEGNNYGIVITVRHKDTAFEVQWLGRTTRDGYQYGSYTYWHRSDDKLVTKLNGDNNERS